MQSYSAEGVALLARKYRGSGRVVSFFTLERGKVEAVAQGVGKPGSSLAAAVELFTHSRLFLVAGRNLDRLTQARVIEAFEAGRRDPVRLGYAGFLCELLARATEPGEPLPAAFSDLLSALKLLNAGYEPVAAAAAAGWRILGDLGVAPGLDHCIRCGAVLEGACLFLATEGGAVCGQCFTEQDGAAEDSHPARPQVRALARTLGRLTMDRLPRVRVDESLWRDLLQVTRLQIRYYLGLDMRSDAYLRQLDRRRRT